MSLYPSWSPDGQTIAFTHSDPSDPCDGSIWLMGADGSNARSLTAGACDAVLMRPVWLDAQTIVAWRWAQQPDGWNDPVELVLIDVQTGEVIEQIATGLVVDFTRRLTASAGFGSPPATEGGSAPPRPAALPGGAGTG
jgi:Tol biopolymer transport system component